MNRICVFCGSNNGVIPAYVQAARQLGLVLASRHIGLVYGGASVGMMGAIADATLKAGGEVVGVMPSVLAAREIAHTNLSELRIVATMHERKAVMAELSDGFIALPGGLGTLDEFFEMLTTAQLGLHKKPCGLLNTNCYYDELIHFLDHATDQQFIKKAHRAMLLVDYDPINLMDQFIKYQAPMVDKWM